MQKQRKQMENEIKNKKYENNPPKASRNKEKLLKLLHFRDIVYTVCLATFSFLISLHFVFILISVSVFCSNRAQ